MASKDPDNSGSSQPHVSRSSRLIVLILVADVPLYDCFPIYSTGSRRPANIRGKDTSEDPNADVTAAVEELLNSLSNKFAGVSSEIFAKSMYWLSHPTVTTWD